MTQTQNGVLCLLGAGATNSAVALSRALGALRPQDLRGAGDSSLWRENKHRKIT